MLFQKVSFDRVFYKFTTLPGDAIVNRVLAKLQQCRRMMAIFGKCCSDPCRLGATLAPPPSLTVRKASTESLSLCLSLSLSFSLSLSHSFIHSLTHSLTHSLSLSLFLSLSLSLSLPSTCIHAHRFAAASHPRTVSNAMIKRSRLNPWAFAGALRPSAQEGVVSSHLS